MKETKDLPKNAAELCDALLVAWEGENEFQRHEEIFRSAFPAQTSEALIAALWFIGAARQESPSAWAMGFDANEAAIQGFRQAIACITPQDYPEAWARFHNSLGATLKRVADPFNGPAMTEVCDAFEIAVTMHRDFQAETLPFLLINLGDAWLDRRDQPRRETCTIAAEYYREAMALLEHAETDDDLEALARARQALAVAYIEMAEDGAVIDVEETLTLLSACAEAFDALGLDEDWAYTQAYLGHAHLENWAVDTGSAAALAQQAYEEALTIFDRETDPEAWAMIQVGLAKCWSNNAEVDPFVDGA